MVQLNIQHLSICLYPVYLVIVFLISGPWRVSILSGHAFFFFYWNCTRRELVTLRIRVTFRKLGFLFCFEQTIQVLTRGFAIVKVSTYWRGFLNVSSLGLEAKKKERNDSNVI